MIQGRIFFAYAGRAIVAALTSDEGWVVTEEVRDGAIASLLNDRFSPALYRPSAGDPVRCAVRDAAILVHGRYEFITDSWAAASRSDENDLLAEMTLSW